MNKGYFEGLMKLPPETLQQKYVFLVSSLDLSLNIISAGFSAVYLTRKDEKGWYTLEEFLDYLSSIQFRGTQMTSYVYVPACATKKENDALTDFFEANFMEYHEGWRLFKDKEYLAKPEAAGELRSLLENFINRFEKKPKEETGLDRFHILGRDGEPKSVMDIEIVEDILAKIPFFVLGSTPYVYQDGVYLEDAGGVRLKAMIQARLYRKFIKSPTLGRILDLLISQSGVQKQFSDLYNLPPEWVNFKNGYYDPVEQVMVPHDPKYLSMNQIPHEFHPETIDQVLSGGEVIKSYLSTAVPDPTEQQMLWEYLGYCMTSDTKMQRFLMLVGEGGTGKSVIISLFQKAVGIRNCSSISLQDLNHRFYATGLFGKLMNACGDIPCKALDSIDVLKKAVGEDSILYEKKGQDALQFFSHAKLLFSSNGMPDNVEEKSDAFYRRLLILEMNHKPAVKDPKLKKKIAKEMDYAIAMAMQALHSLYENGELTESENSRKCVEEARKSTDSVMAFICDMLVVKKDAWLERSRTYDAYNEYCKDNGRQPLGKSKFYTEMKRKGFLPRKVQGIQKFKGISIREPEFEAVGEEETPFG